MFRIAIVTLALFAAVLAPTALAHAATPAADAANHQAEADTLGSPGYGLTYAWGYTAPALHRALDDARRIGHVPVGPIQFGYVPAAGGYAYWVALL